MNIEYSNMKPRRKVSNDPVRTAWLGDMIAQLRAVNVELPAEWPVFDAKWPKALQLDYFRAVQGLYRRHVVLPSVDRSLAHAAQARARKQADPTDPIPEDDASALATSGDLA